MKKIMIGVALLLLGSCRKEDALLPSEIWSKGCSSLTKQQEMYRLDGICCEYVEFPASVRLKHKAFEIEGTQYVFNGAKMIPYPVLVKGHLEGDGVLSLHFQGLGKQQSYRLNPGPAQVACQCGCD